ncbi:MAG TPA: hypothetical protein VEC19_15550 [Usitatibacter sp.]|nr:hypothetical protein [Usitatibacter sp.]
MNKTRARVVIGWRQAERVRQLATRSRRPPVARAAALRARKVQP